MKVLIVYDRRGWCHHMIAESIQHYYDGAAKIDTACQSDDDVQEKIAFSDLVLPLCWPTLLATRAPVNKSLVGIRGYESLPRSRAPHSGQMLERLLHDAAGLVCANRDLSRKWRAYHRNVYIGYSAGDSRRWYPPVKKKPLSKPLIVGWAGNDLRPVKRVYSLLKPAIDKTEGRARLIIAGKANYIPTNQMREKFYHRIDALACTSITEGTPNPALEAMLCGVPVLSTRVGHLREMIRFDSNGWLVDDSVRAISRLLIALSNDPSRVLKNAQGALRTAQEWTWKHKIDGWKKAIDETLERIKNKGRR